MKKNKWLVPTIAGFAALALIIYSGFWFYLAGQIRTEVETFIAEADNSGVRIVTRSFGVRNYPFTPEAYFAGRVNIDNNVIEVPLLLVRSTFLPGRPLAIETPQGLSILEPADTQLWSLDYMLIETAIPASLPAEMYHEDMRAWQDAGNNIRLDKIRLVKGALKLEGDGLFMLDDALQPAGEFKARITGHMEFLGWLRQKRYIETKQALLSSAVLSGFTKTDPDTNEAYVEAALTLQNQTLFLGPLRLAYLPAVQWAWRSEPALPR